MKKQIALILVLIFLFSSIGDASNGGIIQVSMNNNKFDVSKVAIVMDGKEISTSTPSFVHDDRTLVPIRFIEENYGAEVIWIQETRSILVKYNDDTIKLTIDSSTATINGEKRLLDKGSIPRLVTFEDDDTRTMVPLRFLAEALNFEVGWDSENGLPYIKSKVEEEIEEIEEIEEEIKEENLIADIISGIKVSKGSTDKNKIIIESNKELIYETAILQNKSTLIIDIQNVKLLQKNTLDAPGVIKVDDDYVSEVRYSQFSYNPNITRIAIDLKDNIAPNIAKNIGGKGLIVSFESNLMKNITKEVVNGEGAIVLEGVDPKNMNIIKLKNPERLVIDFLDTVLDGEPYVNYPYDLGFIKGVRVSQFKADTNYSSSDQIVRIVLDIKDGIMDPNIRIDAEDNKVRIYPEESFWEKLSYEQVGNERHFILKELLDTKHDLDYDHVTKTLNIIVAKENIELNNGLIIINDELLDNIRVKVNELDTHISLQFKKTIEYTEVFSDIDDEIHLIINRKSNVKASDRLIVIDAGHGGRDPGAISYSKKNEKDFNLIVSLKLNERLKALGYNTLLTRDTDVFVDLYERAKIANDTYADIFVSIHANANNNRSIAGLQMLYTPAFNSQIKEKDQHPLAKAMMDEMMKATGAPNRGIIQSRAVVVRETRMPAVLVEAGFLSNPEEDQLLFTDAYQNKVVDGIINGIESYFEID